MVSLDGHTSFIGTEFIKLLNTGSSNLATEEFVNTAIINGGGGGGADLTNYYDKTETDALLNNKYNKSETDTLLDTKLNVNNPQNMEGTLNIGSVGGTSKIIINAVSSSKDFYVNGDAQILGNHLVASLDSSGYIKGSNIQSNTFNALNLNDILFQSNNDTYLQYDVSATKLVASKLIQCGGNLTTQEIDTIAPLDLVIKRNGVDFITLADGEIQFNQPTNLAITPDLSNCVKLTGEASQTIAGDVVVGGALNTNTLNSNGNSDIVLQRNGIEYMKLEGTLQAVELTKGAKSNTYDSIGNADVNFRRNATDFFYLRNNTLDLNSGISLSTDGATINEISSKTATNLVIRRAGVNYITLTDGQIQFNQPTNLATGGDTSNCVKYTGETLQTIDGDVVIGGGAQFGSFDLTVNGTTYFSSTVELPFGGAINLGTGKGFLRSVNLGGGNTGYDYVNYSSGGLHRFYVSGSAFPQFLRFQLSSTQAYFNVDVVCHTELQTDVINTKNATDVDLVFKRNDVNIFKLNTSNQIQLLGGNETSFMYEEAYFDLVNYNVLRIRNTENVDNGIISFGVGDVLDVFQIYKTGLTSTVELSLPQVLCNLFDSFAGDNDVVFNRNGVEFFRLQGSNVVTNGPENLLLVNDGNVGISSSWMFANTFAINRTADSDTDFRGCISSGLASGTVYMTYEHIPERLHIKTDAEVSEGKKLYLNTSTSKECYIHSFIESNVKIMSLVNSDTSGQNRIYCGGNLVIDMSGTVLNLHQNTTVVAGKNLTGELVDTSSEKVKYDIKDADYDFTTIVKNIKPKTFKMNEEKKQGIIKNHLGFVAEEVQANIPTDVDNIIFDGDVKKLNYVKLNGILWGCVQQQQQKIEHLEARLFEVENFIKDFVKPKPKTKAKAKTKAEN